MRSPFQYLALVRHLGVGWMGFRVRYALRRKSGALRRATPAVAWDEVPATELHLGSRALPVSTEISGTAVREADALLLGRFRLFSRGEVTAGNPPDWHSNQLTGELAPADRHWSELGDFAFGDIKGIWELSRFSWAYALTRAHARTGDAKYAEAFWRLFADWCARNPPNRGANWMCGQEATFRLMAVVFAAEGLGVPPAQRELLARFIVATGRRIAANLDYALSQKNNHGVSECVGLITAALLTPEHPESTAWRARGLRELAAQVHELVYPDGGFSQHSLIYHRVLLHDLVWAKVRLEQVAQPVPAWLLAGGRRATDFLLTLTDRASGWGPLYGPNDGANILPLAAAEFLDLRPAVQLAAAVFLQKLPFVPGPWDEAVAWLVPGGKNLPRVADTAPAAVWHAREAGCFQLTTAHSRLFLRCPVEFRHRPNQADMLHVDIWHRGRPVALDGGSYSYNSRERFTQLGAAAQHNALTIDGIEPMAKFSRFLYLPWPHGTATVEGAGCTASHDGYKKLGVQWTREVKAAGENTFIVTDRVAGAAGRVLRWHWRLDDRAWVLAPEGGAVVDPASGIRIAWSGGAEAPQVRLIRADEATASGWWSPYYGEVTPACALVIELRATGPVEWRTEFLLPADR
ncbi:MAG: alginate lyase family protein [Verrucomicrobia bacterium]|nr:alginate lyase family protein [Verrucomicrobiota bacterium]